MKEQIIIGAGDDDTDDQPTGLFVRLDKWLGSLAKRASAFIDRYRNIVFLLAFALPLLIGMTASLLPTFSRLGSDRPDSPSAAVTTSQKDLQAIQKQQIELAEKAKQIETRLSTLSAADVSKRIESFEAEIAALDTYIEQLFEPTKGKDVLVVKSIVDDLRQLRERSSTLRAEIETLREDRIRIETKIDQVQAHQTTLLQWVLSIGAFLFLGLLLSVRYIGKKIEPLLLVSTSPKSEDPQQSEKTSG
jgi:hypothetical protein